jgi:DNA recombination protein RmuC
MNSVLFTVGDTPITVVQAMAGAAGLIAVLLLVLLIIAWRAAWQRADEAAREAERSEQMQRHLADMMQKQSEMTGRMQTMSEIFGTRTSDLTRALSERIEASSHRVNQSMTESRAKTEESLAKLNERLAVIDRAQNNIAKLSGEIVSLQSILSNKQTRGAFGQGRMEAIIADGLPMGGSQIQPTLSNGYRPDCLVLMPNDAPALVIDAKFPLESWQRINEASSPEELKLATNGFKSDIWVHVKAISQKYLISGETQDTAFMFVPSESIFADLHERFEDVVQRALRERVVIVSPSILMLSVQVIMALMRDVRMREQAHLIQKEVHELLTDVSRLDDRVRQLQRHFGQANSDIGDILTSTGKVTRRGERITDMDFEEQKQQLAGE